MMNTYCVMHVPCKSFNKLLDLGCRMPGGTFRPTFQLPHLLLSLSFASSVASFHEFTPDVFKLFNIARLRVCLGRPGRLFPAGAWGKLQLEHLSVAVHGQHTSIYVLPWSRRYHSVSIFWEHPCLLHDGTTIFKIRQVYVVWNTTYLVGHLLISMFHSRRVALTPHLTWEFLFWVCD